MPDASRALRRSQSDRKIAGVLGGLARYFALDPTLVRAVYVVVSILSVAFPGILVYLVLWFLIPPDGDATHSS
jgi:phage shock protein PspC (stress-responsive transcriptional regulator)